MLPFAQRRFTLLQMRTFFAQLACDWPRQWTEVRGPLGALKVSAYSIGWRIAGPDWWVTDRGISLDLSLTSPASYCHRAAPWA